MGWTKRCRKKIFCLPICIMSKNQYLGAKLNKKISETKLNQPRFFFQKFSLPNFAKTLSDWIKLLAKPEDLKINCKIQSLVLISPLNHITLSKMVIRWRSIRTEFSIEWKTRAWRVEFLSKLYIPRTMYV